MVYGFWLTVGIFYMHHPTDRLAHTITVVKPIVEHVLEQEIAQLVHHEGFLIPASAPQLWYVLSCLWDDAYKRVAYVAAAGFLSCYLSGPLPYVWRYITVK